MRNLNAIVGTIQSKLTELYMDKGFSFATGIILTLCVATIPYLAGYAFIGGIAGGIIRGIFDAKHYPGDLSDVHCEKIWIGALVGQVFMWMFLHTWI